MAAVDITRRRNVQRTVAEAPGDSSFVCTDRPGTMIAHHQQLHHHHHQHQHHHHHHYHNFPRQFGRAQDQGTLMSSASTSAGTMSRGGSPSNIGQQRSSTNWRMSFINYVRQLNHPQEATMEASDGLDERLGMAANLSHRHRNVDLQGHFLHELSALFDDDEDFWSDDEIWEIDMRDWLEAWGFEEGWHSDHPSTSEVSVSTGLTKAAIRHLHRQVFVPKELTGDNEVGDGKAGSSEQDDCCVCLEHFLRGQVLICLPCMHRFHPDCLTPWLESHGQCPYCRAKVSCEGTGEASSSHQGVRTGSTISPNEDDLLMWMEAVDSGVLRLNIT